MYKRKPIYSGDKLLSNILWRLFKLKDDYWILCDHLKDYYLLDEVFTN